ncbi:DUF1570 domain-containing protein [Corallococcus terminator]
MNFHVVFLSLVLVLSTGCAGSRALCPREGGRPWSEVQSEHFRIQTNLTPQSATATALELEKLRRALLLAWGTDFNPPGTVDVILLRNANELKEFIEGNYVGFVAPTQQGTLLVMSGEGYLLDDGPEQELQTHELAHELSRHVLLRQSRWLAEGLAQYLQTTHVKVSTQEAVLGRANKNSLAYVRQHGWLDVDELWAWDQKESMSAAETQQHYASAWVWVHYLINMHTERFDELQTRLARAEDPRSAWDIAFKDAGDLRGDLRTFVWSGRSAILTLPLPPVPRDVTVRELDSADVHALRGRMHLHGIGARPQEERIQKARAEVEQGLKEDPVSVSVAVLAAQLHQNPPEHLARARTLVQAHPDDGRAWDLLAEHLDPNGESQPLEQARQRAAELLPNDSRILASLAAHYQQTRQPEKGLPVARRAVELAPGDPFALMLQAAMSFQLDRCKEALGLQRRALDMLHESTPDSYRKQLRERLQLFEAKCGANASSASP